MHKVSIACIILFTLLGQVEGTSFPCNDPYLRLSLVHFLNKKNFLSLQLPHTFNIYYGVIVHHITNGILLWGRSLSFIRHLVMFEKIPSRSALRNLEDLYADNINLIWYSFLFIKCVFF